MSITLVMAIVVLGLAFKIFWTLYQEGVQNQVFLQKNQAIFSAQRLINERIHIKSTSNGVPKDFSISSENAFVYRGKVIETQTSDGIYYDYFYPQEVSR
ncbi:hypothetical protein [Helicobacter sp. 11S03491-1]|uniref:hypothetical protein n=1 Tax=Helicobacter sp. 11S03491-1 TaxID=1476196 RepID=UPI0015DADD62|nr:hypothetical protein [Helicobacter sp. 11S03491-1]